MDGTSRSSKKSARTVSFARKRIGFICKEGPLQPDEGGTLYYLGRCIARLGHTLVTTEAENEGTNLLRKGMKVEDGILESVQRGVIEASDHTWIYADTHLLERVRSRHPDLDTREDVLIVYPEQLVEWAEAVRQVMYERGVIRP